MKDAGPDHDPLHGRYTAVARLKDKPDSGCCTGSGPQPDIAVRDAEWCDLGLKFGRGGKLARAA